MALSRSQQMSRIRRSDTTPEKILRALLWNARLRYRVDAPTPGGRADVVFRTTRVAVYVDGCFWHGCPKHYVFPRTSRSFWLAKLQANVARDQRQTAALSASDWTVIRLWEHEVYEQPALALRLIRRALMGQSRRTKGWRVWHVSVAGRGDENETRRLVTVMMPIAERVQRRRRTTAKSLPPQRKTS
jgi:DNA mismatch endonuclease (patch repair protein)